MTETEIRQRIIKHVNDKHTFFQPIESGVTGVGIPDIFYRCHGVDGWLELKIGDVHEDFSVSVTWRPGQLGWIHRYLDIDGIVILAIGLVNNTVGFIDLTKYVNGDDVPSVFTANDFDIVAVIDKGHAGAIKRLLMCGY